MSVFTLSTLAVFWFAACFVLNVINFDDPSRQDEALKPWMTLRYVMASYDLSRPIVLETLNLSERDPHGRSLGELAVEMDVTLEALTERVRTAYSTYRNSGE